MKWPICIKNYCKKQQQLKPVIGIFEETQSSQLYKPVCTKTILSICSYSRTTGMFQIKQAWDWPRGSGCRAISVWRLWAMNDNNYMIMGRTAATDRSLPKLCLALAKNKIFFVSLYATNPKKMALPKKNSFSWFGIFFFFLFTKINTVLNI